MCMEVTHHKPVRLCLNGNLARVFFFKWKIGLVPLFPAPLPSGAWVSDGTVLLQAGVKVEGNVAVFIRTGSEVYCKSTRQWSYLIFKIFNSKLKPLFEFVILIYVSFCFLFIVFFCFARHNYPSEPFFGIAWTTTQPPTRNPPGRYSQESSYDKKNTLKVIIFNVLLNIRFKIKGMYSFKYFDWLPASFLICEKYFFII